jgi:hypothetical protein
MFKLEKFKENLIDDGRIFDRTFELLQRQKSPYSITQIYSPDNVSSIFDNFLSNCGGTLFSINEKIYKQIKYAPDFTKEENSFSSFNPFRILRSIRGSLNLLYLNSFNKNWEESHATALFNMHLISSAAHMIYPGSLILLDDCFEKEKSLSSKWWRPMGQSYYISVWLDRIGAVPIFKEPNQQLWIMKN